MQLDKNFYPGFTRKAMTFTIDDGNLLYDKKFIDIVKPAGICGTFNLCNLSLEEHSREYYREFYSGFGIANHCKRHPFAFDPDKEYVIADEPFDRDTADESKLYPLSLPGLYRIHLKIGWRPIASYECYLSLVDEAQRELEDIFGKGRVNGFVWPFAEQKDTRIKSAVLARGYGSIRKTGALSDTTGYSLPADRSCWSYNANHIGLVSEGEKYDAYPDDGELKFFAFGLHSVDYEKNNCWDELLAFAQRFGNRREDFYYASVNDIFEYEDASRALQVGEEYVYNPSKIPLYIKLNDNFVIIAPGERLNA